MCFWCTQNCENLENLIPGDLIIADKSFNIHNSAGIYCAEIKLQSFIRGKKQLSNAEISTPQQLSHDRIHVEQVKCCATKTHFISIYVSYNLIMCDTELSGSVSTMENLYLRVVLCCDFVFNKYMWLIFSFLLPFSSDNCS